MFNKVWFLTRYHRGNNQQYYYSLHLRQIIVKYFYRVLIVFKNPFLHFPSWSIDYRFQFSTVIYNFGYRRRIANRSGELRHEEFSHCYIHESVGREKFRRTSSYNFSNNHFKTFGERRRTNRECKRNSEKLFKKVIFCLSSVLFLVLSETKRRLKSQCY